MFAENTRIFIGNIYYSVTVPELHALFSQAGIIEKLELFTDENGSSRGCGIVQFSSHREALQAIRLFHRFELKNRRITVKEDENFYLQIKRPTQIIIRKMPVTVTWQQLKDVCRDLGSVLRADVRLESNDTATGTVLYETCADALKAVQLLNGALFNQMKVEAFIDTCN
jgi:RNA recognition motif-containing protein